MNKNNKLRGIGYMILNSFALSLIYILMKKLSIDLNSSQVVFFYKFCCLIIILPWVFNEGMQILKTPQLKLHILRGFFSAAGSLFFMSLPPTIPCRARARARCRSRLGSVQTAA